MFRRLVEIAVGLLPAQPLRSTMHIAGRTGEQRARTRARPLRPVARVISLRDQGRYLLLRLPGEVPWGMAQCALRLRSCCRLSASRMGWIGGHSKPSGGAYRAPEAMLRVAGGFVHQSTKYRWGVTLRLTILKELKMTIIMEPELGNNSRGKKQMNLATVRRSRRATVGWRGRRWL